MPLSNKDIGYLPGDIKSKVNPYMQPLWDNLNIIKHQYDEKDREYRKIDEMVEIVRRDAPWLWGFHPTAYTLYHSWFGNAKPNLMGRNTLKSRKTATETDPEFSTHRMMRARLPLRLRRNAF